MERKDLLLLILSKAKKDGLTPAQFQKAVFLVQKVCPKEIASQYHFVPYNYGPFDVSIYNDASELEKEGYLTKVQVDNQRWSKYYISKAGIQYLERLTLDQNVKLVEFTSKLVKWIQSLTFQELISSIYRKYPEYKVNSVFVE